MTTFHIFKNRWAAFAAWSLALALAAGTAFPQPSRAISPDSGGSMQMRQMNRWQDARGAMGRNILPESIPRCPPCHNLHFHAESRPVLTIKPFNDPWLAGETPSLWRQPEGFNAPPDYPFKRR